MTAPPFDLSKVRVFWGDVEISAFAAEDVAVWVPDEASAKQVQAKLEVALRSFPARLSNAVEPTGDR